MNASTLVRESPITATRVRGQDSLILGWWGSWQLATSGQRWWIALGSAGSRGPAPVASSHPGPPSVHPGQRASRRACQFARISPGQLPASHARMMMACWNAGVPAHLRRRAGRLPGGGRGGGLLLVPACAHQLADPRRPLRRGRGSGYTGWPPVGRRTQRSRHLGRANEGDPARAAGRRAGRRRLPLRALGGTALRRVQPARERLWPRREATSRGR
jgi:hypothetical protein